MRTCLYASLALKIVLQCMVGLNEKMKKGREFADCQVTVKPPMYSTKQQRVEYGEKGVFPDFQLIF